MKKQGKVSLQRRNRVISGFNIDKGWNEKTYDRVKANHDNPVQSIATFVQEQGHDQERDNELQHAVESADDQEPNNEVQHVVQPVVNQEKPMDEADYMKMINDVTDNIIDECEGFQNPLHVLKKKHKKTF